MRTPIYGTIKPIETSQSKAVENLADLYRRRNSNPHELTSLSGLPDIHDNGSKSARILELNNSLNEKS